MVCPHCGATTTAVAGRCPSCNGLLDQTAPRRVAAGLLTPVPPPVAEDETRLGQTGSTGVGPLAPGQSFGSRYHIIRLLGVGGMGAVYQAWDDELGVAVAIKVIRPEITADPAVAADLHRRFKRELLLARQVTHRNVVRIHDIGELDGIKYITMPLIQGQDLATILRTAGRLPVSAALNLAKQIVAGLRAAHEAGVVHRDLKPANIMVEEERAVIMDFGIARAEAGGGSTVLGTVVGTLEYMAPEQARGEAVDHRADLYALGLILYDMLVGRRHASRPDSVVAELMGRMEHAPPSPRTVDPQIPGAVDVIVMRCLQANPAIRYQTVSELAADLDALDADGHPLAGRTVTSRIPVPRGNVWQRMPRWAWAAVALVIILAGVGVYALRDRIGGTAPAPVVAGQPVTLAILPFRNASGDPSLDWLAASFAEMLRTELGQSSYLHTVPSDRVHQILRDLRLSSQTSFDPNSLRRLAEFGNAETLLWGQYLKFGPEIRFNATLENVKEQRSVTLNESAPSEASLLPAITRMADSIRATVTSSPDIVKELQAKAFKPSTQSVQALRYYTEGLALSREGKHAEALKRFDAAVEADRSFALAYSRQAQIYDRLNQDDDAQRVSSQAVGLAQELPPREKYVIEAAHARIAGDSRKAIEAYTNLSKVSPDDSEVDFALAGLYEATGVYDRAHAHLSKVLQRDPKYLDALILMGRVEIRRSKWQAALDRLNPALSLAIEFENDEAKANALHALGVVYRRTTKPDEALRHYQQALEIKQRLGQKGSIATTLNEIGQVQVQLGKADEAMASYTEALKLRREVGDKRGTGSSLIDLGVFHAGRSRHDEALKFYKEALQIQRELGNVDYEAMCLNNIGNVYLVRGQYDDAVTYFRLTLELRERSKDLPGSAVTLHNLGEAYAKMGQFDDSLAHYLRSLEVWRKADERRSAAMELHYMATVFEHQGRHGAAVNAREEALKTLHDLKDKSIYLAGVQSGYGRALNQVGRFDEAGKQLDEAVALARQLKHQALVARTFNHQGEGALYRGDTKSARTLFEQALPVAQAMKNSELIVLSKLNLAKVAIDERKPQQAVGILRGLAAEAEAGGLKYIAAEASVSLGEALLAMRQVAQATAELKQILARSEKLGMQPLAARSHALLAQALRASGGQAAAARHASEARRILDTIRKEAGSGDPLKRADLRAIYTETSQ
jgi:eukaryotic-like serine/threonine-protein kinase